MRLYVESTGEEIECRVERQGSWYIGEIEVATLRGSSLKALRDLERVIDENTMSLLDEAEEAVASLGFLGVPAAGEPRRVMSLQVNEGASICFQFEEG